MNKAQWLAGLAVIALGAGALMYRPFLQHSTVQDTTQPADSSAMPVASTTASPAIPPDGQRDQTTLSDEDLAKLEAYEQWLEDNRLLLQGMPLLERQSALWKKREALFGDDASQIWGEQPSPLHENEQVLQAELQRLDQAREITPEETAHQLKTTVEQLYNNDMARQLIGPGVMARTLFSLDSVQSHLKELPADARQARINRLRQQLGYPEDAISRLEEQDQQRNERWEKGKAYMSERVQLTRQYTGDQLDQALDDLRKEYFGRSAKTIALEEQDGFFRFERERRFGVN